MVKQVYEDRREKELAGPAYGRLPRQLFIYFIAEKKQNVQPEGAVFNEPGVADQVFQPAHHHQLEENDRVERGLPRVAVKGSGLVVEKCPIDHFGQSPVEIVRGPRSESRKRVTSLLRYCFLPCILFLRNTAYPGYAFCNNHERF